jgi:TPR repeat protein
MFDLGKRYEHGDSVAQDYGKAREWYEKAAAKGDADGKARLGR